MDQDVTTDSVPSARHDQGQEKEGSQITIKADRAVPQKASNSKDQTISDVSIRARDWTSHVLRFLSNASNETLGACLVGLGATTYLLLGRVGLVLIGIVGGVVLHATWEDSGPIGASEEVKAAEARKRRENGLDVLRRVLDWREDKSDGHKCFENEGEGTPMTSSQPDFSSFSPETKDALGSFSGAIIRDYVHWWYGPILPAEESFPVACCHTLNRFFVSMSSHLSRKRPGDVFLDFLTNSSSIVIVFLSELSGALAASRGLEPQEAINEYLEENPGCSLANVFDEKQQKRKLKAVAEDILQTFLDAQTYACDPIRAFLREVLAGLILDMTITSCSRAEFINEWIIYAFEEGETTELVQAIDAGVSSATSSGAVKTATTMANGKILDKSQPPNSSSAIGSQTKTEHRRAVSNAEDAMEEAMQEAKRLSELIAEEEAKKVRHSQDSAQPAVDSTVSALAESFPNDRAAVVNSSITAPAENSNGIVETPSSTHRENAQSFTSFDQILSSQQPTALQSEDQRLQSLSVPSLTLHNATVSIFDDSVPGEKGNLRSKPVVEYLLQIEPSTSQYPGWMIARKYSDFETLHEVLRRISVVSGVAAFTERHQSLPGWKSKTKALLRVDLEKYLQDALSFQRLAESEGMKRFLEKDQHLGKSSPGANKGAFGFPSPAAFETMGKGMLDVLTSAPKGAAVGGKAIVGGVTGVLGGVGTLGQKKHSTKSSDATATHDLNGSLSRIDSNASPKYGQDAGRPSQDSFQHPLHTSPASSRFSIEESDEIMKPPPLPQRQNPDASGQQSEIPSTVNLSAPLSLPAEQDQMHLPPPPSEIPDDYNTTRASPRPSLDASLTLRTSTSTAPTADSPPLQSAPSPLLQNEAPAASPPEKPKRPAPTPLTIQETSVAVELFFAMINELYTLSSAWTLRLALLNTAKSFLLRPGNANLESIRQLLQSTIIDANTSDTGIATHINKIRENALPTEEELKAWPPPPNEEEKERKRKKARKLLVEKGMPQALTSVMGQAASGEALGKVFDCLQVPEVAKGLVFALVLQAVKALTQ
ncbi:MAG: hypothetical protein Q9164_005631 [Protoblastenia rupestris]